MWHAFPGLPGGRYRRYLSLREGSEQPPEAALKEGTQTYEMAVAPVGKNPLFPLPWMIPDRSSPSRVRFRRFAPWTAAGRSEGDGCL